MSTLARRFAVIDGRLLIGVADVRELVWGSASSNIDATVKIDGVEYFDVEQFRAICEKFDKKEFLHQLKVNVLYHLDVLDVIGLAIITTDSRSTFTASVECRTNVLRILLSISATDEVPISAEVIETAKSAAIMKRFVARYKAYKRPKLDITSVYNVYQIASPAPPVVRERIMSFMTTSNSESPPLITVPPPSYHRSPDMTLTSLPPPPSSPSVSPSMTLTSLRAPLPPPPPIEELIVANPNDFVDRFDKMSVDELEESTRLISERAEQVVVWIGSMIAMQNAKESMKNMFAK